MPYGPQTQTVDGQRNVFPSRNQYAPMTYGVQSTGVPQVSPTMPPFVGTGAAGGAGAALGMGAEGVDGYGTAGNNQAATRLAADNPMSLHLSPLWWAIICLVGGLFILHKTAWRRVIEAEGGARVGNAEARAEAEA